MHCPHDSESFRDDRNRDPIVNDPFLDGAYRDDIAKHEDIYIAQNMHDGESTSIFMPMQAPKTAGHPGDFLSVRDICTFAWWFALCVWSIIFLNYMALVHDDDMSSTFVPLGITYICMAVIQRYHAQSRSTRWLFFGLFYLLTVVAPLCTPNQVIRASYLTIGCMTIVPLIFMIYRR
jgi:hypothetical protein